MKVHISYRGTRDWFVSENMFPDGTAFTDIAEDADCIVCGCLNEAKRLENLGIPIIAFVRSSEVVEIPTGIEVTFDVTAFANILRPAETAVHA